MQEDIFPDVPKSKLYTDESIRVGTLLGGPLVAGYLISENYKQLGEQGKTRTTWLYAILTTIVVFIIAFFLPENIPKYILPFAYSIATFYLVQNLQGEKIRAHRDAGGQIWSVWRAVLAGIIGGIILIAIYITVFFLVEKYLVSPA